MDDLTGLAPFLALPAAAVAALYPFLRDRSHLTRVERITRILSDDTGSAKDLSAAERAVLGALRLNSIETIGLAWLSESFRRDLFLSIWSFGWCAGILVAYGGFLIPLGKTNWIDLTISGSVGIGLLVLGSYSFRNYRAKRAKSATYLADFIRSDDSKQAQADQTPDSATPG